MSLTLQKQKLRQQFREQLKQISPEEQFALLTQLDTWLSDYLSGLKTSQNNFISWAAFRPLAGEPDLDSLLFQTSLYFALSDQVSLTSKIKWLFPKVIGEELRFYQCSLSQFSKGSFGILEPDSQKGAVEFKSQDIDGVLVPGLAFDENGGRLGRGRGYYDRFLSQFAGIKMGIGFSKTVVNKLPLEKHDVKLDGLITDKGFTKWNW